jgi:hypothetical protein
MSVTYQNIKTSLTRNYLIEQWEALVLLLIGISVNQLRATPTGTTFGFPEATGAYVYTLFFVRETMLMIHPV